MTVAGFIVFGVIVLLFAVSQYFLRRRLHDDERRNWPHSD